MISASRNNLPFQLMWYAVSILYESQINSQSDLNSIWEESIVLLQAEDEISAAAKANIFSRKEYSYKNDDGDEVTWNFNTILSIFLIGVDNPGDTTEVFSRFLKKSEVDSLLRSMD